MPISPFWLRRVPALLPTSTMRRQRWSELEQLCVDQAGRRRTTSARAMSSAPRTVISPGSPGPAPTRWTVTVSPSPAHSSIVDRSGRRQLEVLASRRPSASGSRPVAERLRTIRPSWLATIASSAISPARRHPGRTPPPGALQPPPIAASQARSASTAGASRRRRPRPATRASPASSVRHSTAIAPWPTWGSIEGRSRTSATRSARPSLRERASPSRRLRPPRHARPGSAMFPLSSQKAQIRSDHASWAAPRRARRHRRSRGEIVERSPDHRVPRVAPAPGTQAITSPSTAEPRAGPWPSGPPRRLATRAPPAGPLLRIPPGRRSPKTAR